MSLTHETDSQEVFSEEEESAIVAHAVLGEYCRAQGVLWINSRQELVGWYARWRQSMDTSGKPVGDKLLIVSCELGKQPKSTVDDENPGPIVNGVEDIEIGSDFSGFTGQLELDQRVLITMMAAADELPTTHYLVV